MRSFDPPAGTVREVVARALAEDLGVLGDITSLALVDAETLGSGSFLARRSGVVAGTAPATEVFAQLDGGLDVRWEVADGEEVTDGQVIGRVAGHLRPMLTGERTALNFLCHLSGIADVTRRFVRATHGRSRIRDTRKTLPGLRAFEKAAVRAGGGFNHREGLSDAVLIKDNHVRVAGIAEAVGHARAHWPGRPIGVECDTLEQLEEALPARPDLVLLDNMTPDQVARAVEVAGGLVQLEVSGGVSIENVAAYAAAGPDFIAIGAITHSARSLDIGFDLD